MASKDSYGALGKSDLFFFDPEELTLVDDKDHPLHDPHRIAKMPSEGFVQNIIANGVLEPVLVRLNGKHPKTGKPIVEVVAGRKRTLGTRLANKILKKQGAELLRVPGIIKKGDDAYLMGVMIAENEQRESDSMLAKAKKLQRFLNLGRSIEEGAMHFDVTVTAARNWMKLLDCDDSVQEAVEEGTIAPSNAAQLAELPRAEQKKALDVMVASGATKGASAAAAVRRALAEEKSSTAGEKAPAAAAGAPGEASKPTKPKKDDGDEAELVPSKPTLKKVHEALVAAIDEGKWSEENIATARTVAQTIAFVLDGEKLPRVAHNVFTAVVAEVREKKQRAAERAFEKKAAEKAAEKEAEKQAKKGGKGASKEAPAPKAVGKKGKTSAPLHEEEVEEETEEERAATAARNAKIATSKETKCGACDGLGFTDHKLTTVCPACDGEGSREAEVARAAIRAGVASTGAVVEGGSAAE